MAIEVKMPQLGESVHEGMIGKWLKAEGDTVEKYEPLLEVVTDKVDTEVTASDSGTLLKIIIPEGETVEVGTALAWIGAAGESVGDAGGAVNGTGVESAAGSATEAPTEEPTGAPAAPATAPAMPPAAATATSDPAPAAPARVSPVAARMAAEHGLDPATIDGTGPGGQVKRADIERAMAAPAAATDAVAEAAPAAGRDLGFISPRVARLSAQHGVDLRAVPGTGRDGRITARDVEAFVDSGAAAPAAPAAPSAPATVPASPAAPVAAPLAAASSAAAPVVGSAGVNELLGEVVPLTRMRKFIADHMVRSKQTSPHVSTVHEVDMSRVMATYRDLRDDYKARGTRLTITAIIVDVVAQALREHPMVNSAWTDEGVLIQRDVNIGMAVAIEEGLIVPVIRNADEKSLAGIARDIGSLAAKARDKQLAPDDIQGGTFTLTNYGTLGSLFGTPVINQPQAAILGTGAIKKRVVVIEDPEAGDQIAIRPMMYLALTFDHRILDGGSADPFMRTVVEGLESYRA